MGDVVLSRGWRINSCGIILSGASSESRCHFGARCLVRRKARKKKPAPNQTDEESPPRTNRRAGWRLGGGERKTPGDGQGERAVGEEVAVVGGEEERWAVGEAENEPEESASGPRENVY